MFKSDYELLKCHADIFESTNADVIKVMLNLVVRVAATTDVFSQDSVRRLQGIIPTRKSEMTALLVDLLKDNIILKKYYEHMNELEKAFVQEIVHGDSPTIDFAQFEAKYNTVPPYSYRERHYYKNQLDEKRFYPLCLLVSSDGYLSEDLKKRFRTFVPKPKAVDGNFIEALPSYIERSNRWAKEKETALKIELVTHQTEHAALHDVQSILRLISSNKISINPATYIIARNSIESVRKSLLNGDFYPEGTETEDSYDVQMGEEGIRPFAWILLSQAAKLCKPEGNKLKLTAKGQEALTQPASSVLKDLWAKWMDTTLIHELNRVNLVKGQRSRSNPLRAASVCRGCIKSALSKLSVGKWLSTEEFEKHLVAHGYRFAVARDIWELYVGDKEYGNFGYEGHEAVLNRRYVFAFLLEYAATLGVIDVALTLPWESYRDDLKNLWGTDDYSCLSRYDGLMYLRLTPLGAWILGMTSQYTETKIQRTTAFKVTPNLEINVLADKLIPADELFLKRISDRVSERTWKLSRKNILTVLEEGLSIDRITEFLFPQDNEEILQTVGVFLKDIAERTQKIKYAGACHLLECADEATALLLTNDTQLKKMIVVANQKYLVIKEADHKKFREQLKKIGYVV